MKRTIPGFIDFTSLGTELTLDELFTVNGGYCGGGSSGGSCSGGSSGGGNSTSPSGSGNSGGSNKGTASGSTCSGGSSSGAGNSGNSSNTGGNPTSSGTSSSGSCSGGKSGGSSTTSTTPGKGNSSGSASNTSTGGDSGMSKSSDTGKETATTSNCGGDESEHINEQSSDSNGSYSSYDKILSSDLSKKDKTEKINWWSEIKDCFPNTQIGLRDTFSLKWGDYFSFEAYVDLGSVGCDVENYYSQGVGVSLNIGRDDFKGLDCTIDYQRKGYITQDINTPLDLMGNDFEFNTNISKEPKYEVTFPIPGVSVSIDILETMDLFGKVGNHLDTSIEDTVKDIHTRLKGK